MELGIYDIIKSSAVTTKALQMRQKFSKHTFIVNKLANKIMIRHAVEKIWDVKVRDVRIVNLPGKRKRVAGARFVKMSDKKKAIITLKPGYSIDLPDQFESMGLGTDQ
jgi:large subunit ribosomal protein L23